MNLDLTDRRIYGFATEEHLRFADVDANGHINNGAFLQLLENARVSYMREIVRRTLKEEGLPRFRVVVGRHGDLTRVTAAMDMGRRGFGERHHHSG